MFMDIGYSSRLGYDEGYYPEKVEQSTTPLNYALDPNQISNCNACLNLLGPISSYNGFGTSTLINGNPNNTVAPALNLVDLDSIFSNRNVRNSKLRNGKLNPIGIEKLSSEYKIHNYASCPKPLNPLSSRLTYPPQTYRSMAINRFYNLPKNPQDNVFWNFAVDTKLEAKDNYTDQIPNIKKYDPVLSI